ncbi:ATP-dependent helicase [Vibrio coralliilyticus]|uniref:ATP-dependent helicase n=1 Tax=Vibrio coralliilyticus TaxID=190893 RepID=UPI001E33467E|nr:ATP-dependent helicase [Vibrio coralliilyticus]MCC2524974.1 ATP-dependent helicase [Vibrio coralliilyticus]
MKKYLEGMTERQVAAITNEGCTAVTAGAGAGKTAVLTRRVYRLLLKYRSSERKHPPVVAITFTRDAAKEMDRRIKDMAGKSLAKMALATTMHQFAINKILKPNFHLPFFKKQGFKLWKIASGRDSFFHLNQATDIALSNKQLGDFKQLEKSMELKEWMSLVRAFGHSPSSYFAQNKAAFHGVASTLQELLSYDQLPTNLNDTQRRNFYCLKIWHRYVEINRKHSMIDLDEVLVQAAHLLERDPAVRRTLRERHPQLLVDEFQDSNLCQFRFVVALAGDGEGLSTFGDIKQAIYGFRGSDPQLFIELLNRFPRHTLVNLPDNFRSASQVVEVGNALARKMTLKVTDEPMIPRNEAKPYEPVIFHEADYPSTEAEWIATKMQWLRDKGIPYHKMGVLYRYRKLGDALENELIERNMPARRVGGSDDKSLYEDERIVDIVLFIHILFNPSSKKAMSTFIAENSGFGIDRKEYNVLFQKHGFAGNHHKAISYFTNQHFSQSEQSWVVLNSIAQALFDLSARLERVRTFEHYCRHKNMQYDGLPPGQKSKIEKQLGDAYLMAVEEFVAKLKSYYCQSFFMPFASAQVKANAISRHQERINEDFDSIFSYLLNRNRLVHESINVHEYLKSRPLITERTKKDQEENTSDIELMTVHASKGLEKEAIFIVGCSDETWFKDKTASEPTSLNYQEELRLFYVANTRARLQLYITRHKEYKYRNSYYETQPLDFLQYILDLPVIEQSDLREAG